MLKNPANRHRAVGLSADQWQYAFANTCSPDESLRLYERYHVPASGAVFWGSALANIHPGKDDNWVDYHNEKRAPLLFIAGSDDNLMPPRSSDRTPSTTRRRGHVTEVKEFPGPHLFLRGTGGRRSPMSRSTGRSLTITPSGSVSQQLFDEDGTAREFWNEVRRRVAQRQPALIAQLQDDRRGEQLRDGGRVKTGSAACAIIDELEASLRRITGVEDKVFLA